MAKVRLTLARIAAFSCPAGKSQAFLRDTEIPGLAVRATPGGTRSFVFEGKLARRTVRMTIGNVRHWPLDQARLRARELALLIDRGVDPREEVKARKARALAEAKQKALIEVSGTEAWAQYVEERRAVWSQRHYQDHLKLAHPGGEPRRKGGGVTQPGILWGLLQQPLSTLDAEAVERWAKDNAHRPTQARLALRLLRAFFNWCSTHPNYRAIVRGNPGESRRAREALGTPKAKSDSLQREQLALWFEAVRTLNPVIATYLQVLLLTGARPGELLSLRWADTDSQWRSLTIRDKVEGERVIPLTPYVGTLLAALPRRGEYVFMTGKTGQPIAPPNRQALRACEMAGIPPVTLHGLRRSFGTLAEWVEAPVGIVAQIMGHKPSAIAERHYRARPLDLLRAWHTKIEAWILEQAGIPQPKRGASRERLRLVI